MSNQRKILLADDVNFFLTLEKSFLQRDEIEIIVARNGREAYELISLHRPDLALLDLYMPEMNGDDCCRLVKNDPELSNTSIIMVTAGNEEEQAQCRHAGCDDIINKPFDKSVFMGTVQRFLNVIERSEERFKVRMLVMFEKETLCTGFSVDLCAGGLFIETGNLLPRGDVITLKFILPKQTQPICCQGSVAWVNAPDSPSDPSLPTGFGVSFVGLNPDQVQRIQAALPVPGKSSPTD